MRRLAGPLALALCGFGCEPPKASALALKPTAPTAATMPYPPSPPSVLSLAATSGVPSTLVVLLHGFGADATSFHEIARALAPSFPSADFLTPEGFEPSELGGSGRQWYGLSGLDEANRAAQVREAATAVSAWIDRQLDARGLDRRRLVVIGFSQGAGLAAWLAVHRAPPPAAVVMFSGRVTEGEQLSPLPVSTPVFMAHGADDARIPVTVVDPGAATLEAFGVRVTKQIYPGLGHAIDARELRDATAFLRAALAPPNAR